MWIESVDRGDLAQLEGTGIGTPGNPGEMVRTGEVPKAVELNYMNVSVRVHIDAGHREGDGESRTLGGLNPFRKYHCVLGIKSAEDMELDGSYTPRELAAKIKECVDNEDLNLGDDTIYVSLVDVLKRKGESRWHH